MVQPAELQAYLGACAGWPRVHRLWYVIEHQAPLRVWAATEAAALLQQTWDTERFRTACALRGMPCSPAEEAWVAATEAAAQQALAALLADLSACQVHGSREAIRHAHMALGDHYRACGRFREALVHHESAREYANEPAHIFDADRAAMETASDAAEWARVLRHADHAEASLDTQERLGHDTAPMRARLQAFRTLAHWALGETKATAWPEPLGEPYDAYSDLCPPALCAWYAVLWALGAAPAQQRARVAQLQHSPTFRLWAQQAPTPSRVLDAYVQGDWAAVVAQLREARSIWACEPTLGVARAEACEEAVVQQLLARFLHAYRRVSLSSLEHVFGAPVLRLLVQLVEEGLAVRVDVAAQTVDGFTDARLEQAALRHVQQAEALRRRWALAQRLQVGLR